MPETGTPQRKNTLYCSFCGKSQDEVACLIAGPTVFICDECVDLCADILLQMGNAKLKVKSLKHRITQLEVKEGEARAVIDDLAAARAELTELERSTAAATTA